MRQFRLKSCFLLLATADSTAAGQGALPVNAAAVTPYTTMWRVTVVKADGTRLPQGLWSDEVIIGTYEQRPSIRRVQGMTYVNGASATWTNVLDRTTLRPLMDIQHTLRGVTITRQFTDSSVITRREGGAAPDTVRTPLQGVVYDYLAGTYGLLFSTLPLSNGYTMRFRSIDGLTDSVRTVEVKVTGRDTVRNAAGKMVEAWTVVDGNLTYYVAEGTPYVLKLAERLPDGTMMLWELL